MAFSIDIDENEWSEEVLNTLLIDRTTNSNLLWVTEDYVSLGVGFQPQDQILYHNIIKQSSPVICPRVLKTKIDQGLRKKAKAEVFTPSWVCNQQNNLVDHAWFNGKDVFNVAQGESWQVISAKVDFAELQAITGKSWQDYVTEPRIEITCGEAPYLVSRYDAVTGKIIPLCQRIGLLDRKLRIVSENTTNEKEWLTWVEQAFKSVYGFDIQGDNLLIARENLLASFCDYLESKFNRSPTEQELLTIAQIISWNIWQMDGTTLKVPFDTQTSNQPFFNKNDIAVKFGAAVGNPPYQLTVKKATKGNNANTVDIYPIFQELAFNIATCNCLLYPAKDYQRGKKKLNDPRLAYLRIYNGSNKTGEKNIPHENSIFGDSVRRIPGDVGLFYFENNRNLNQLIYQHTRINTTDKILPVRKELISLALKLSSLSNQFQIGTIKKCCESSFVQDHPADVLGEVLDRNLPSPTGYTKVLTNNIAGSGGKARWFYIKTTSIPQPQAPLYKVVIGSAYPNESLKNPNNLEILSPNEMFGRSRLSLYACEQEADALHFVKFLQTKFVKAIIQMTPLKIMYYLPDFDQIKHLLDWSQSLDQIDEQLFKLYQLTDQEIKTILTL